MTGNSYLTQAEIDALNASDLPAATPFAIRNVTQTMFSVARFYGGAKYNGSSYAYLPDSDELIRDDVLRFVEKMRKPPKRKAATNAK